MPLFKTIQEIASYVTISNASTSSGIMPKQRGAEEDYILPVLGNDLFTALQTQVTPGPITQAELLDKVRAALAFLIYYKELPLMHTIITESGLRTVTNDKVQGAYRYQYEATRQHLENEGLSGLEKLFEYLMANADTFPTWKTSDAFTRLNKNLIKTGKDFSSYYYLFQPHRTFFALQPVMQEVEDFYVKSIIGDTFFAFLKDTVSLSPEEITVLGYFKKAVANLTIHKAITKLAVKIRPEGFTVQLASSDRSPASENNAGADQLEQLHQETYRDGNAYLSKAKTYLNSLASEEVFHDYFLSSFYQDPTTAITDPNDCITGIYAF